MGKLTGKRAWITGGGTGIGAGSALALAEGGAEVILSGRRPEPLEIAAQKVRSAGGQAQVYPLDVADAQAVRTATEVIGPVDLLLANAGLNVPNRSLQAQSPESWDRVIQVNLNGVFYAAQAVLPGMRARKGGQVIVISSWAGRYATRLTGAAYNATKRAVIALSESINDEEGAHGIRSTVIMPGEVATDILKSRPNPPAPKELERMLQVEDLAQTVRFVAELPAHACINELLISPTWNRFYQGMDEV